MVYDQIRRQERRGRMFLPIMLAVILFFGLTGPVQGASKPAEGQLSGANASNYSIGPGDILDIVTWKEPDFTQPATLVRIDGKITFPLLNDMQAAGLTPLELKKDIEEGLMAYVDAPVVTVTVRDPASQKFYILGEVLQTGEYTLSKNLTVLQAIAMAGGFTEWASKNEIILLREEGGREKTITIDYKDIVKDQDFRQNLRIRANDTIIVP